MHEFSGLQNPSNCHWSDEFQKNHDVLSENRVPGILGHLAAIQALELTLYTMLWLVSVP